MVDDLNIKLVSYQINILFLENKGKLSFYIRTDDKRVFFGIFEVNPNINIPERVFFNQRSIDLGKNQVLILSKNLSN